MLLTRNEFRKRKKWKCLKSKLKIKMNNLNERDCYMHKKRMKWLIDSKVTKKGKKKSIID